ncbi:hypothetical protein D3C87_1928150 [compost metagenome]
MATATPLATRFDDRRISASTMPPGTASAIVTTVSMMVIAAPCSKASRESQMIPQSKFMSAPGVRSVDTAGPRPA